MLYRYPLGFCTLTLTQVLDRYTVIEIYRVFSQINQGTPSSRHYFTIFRDRTSIWALKRIGPRTIEGKGGETVSIAELLFTKGDFFPDVVYSTIPRDTDIIPHPRQGIPYLDGWHGFRAFTTNQFCSMGSPVMRIYVELPFSPRNSRYSSPSLSLSLFSLCPSLSRSPPNRARNDSLRIFEISLFRNLSSLNISIPSKYYYVLSRRTISRLSIWKKRGGKIVLRSPSFYAFFEKEK